MSRQRTRCSGRQRSFGRLERLEDRTVPAGTHFLAYGTDFGALPNVRVLDAQAGVERLNISAYDPTFRGGVRVAVGDVNNDGVDDLVTAPGASGGPHIRVFDGATGSLTREFFAYDAAFAGGVFVATGDVNLDGYADVITAAGRGGGPHVKVFSGKDQTLLREFFAYDASFAGGVSIASADVNGDGRADIITGAGFGGGPHVKAFSGATGKALADFFAYDASFRGGVFVGGGDANGDGFADIVTGPGVSGGPHVKVFHASGAIISQFFADFGSGATYVGGVRVAAGYSNSDGRLDVVAAGGAGAGSQVRSYDALTGGLVKQATAFDANTSAGASFVCCPSVPDANSVVDWNDAALLAIRTDKTPPPRASRIMAILDLAINDALNPTGAFPAVPRSDDVQVAAAGHRVLTTFFPAQAADFDRRLNAAKALFPDGLGEDLSVTIGQSAADAVLATRANDGSSAIVPYTPSGLAGRWEPTPAAFASFLLPQWGGVTPFAMTSGSQFRPAAPPDISTPEYAVAFNEVKSLGAANSTTRTADQTQIARFWADGAGTITPPGHWTLIAGQFARSRQLDMRASAAMYTALHRASADAGIAAWDAKLFYDYWRPVTAIRKADIDGNAATDLDAGWTPLIATPPFPSYTSGHSTFSGASATVLEHFFGASTGFRTYSLDLPDVSRSFDNFQSAADEAGMSRIYGGIHYSFDNVEGLNAGRAIGQLVLSQI